MTRILQTLINISADVTGEDEARITFTHADMIDGYTITISTVYLIAMT